MCEEIEEAVERVGFNIGIEGSKLESESFWMERCGKSEEKNVFSRTHTSAAVIAAEEYEESVIAKFWWCQ